MSGDCDLAGAAARLGRSYSWFARHWRTLAHPRTLAPFPPPFLGAEKGQRPLWLIADVEAWKAGRPLAGPRTAEGAETCGDFTQREAARPAANDAVQAPPTDRVSALLAAAGG